MQLTPYFFKKLHEQMKLIDLLPTRPKSRIRLDPIDPQDLHIDIETVNKWSPNNSQLVHLLLQNGMATFICNYEFLYEHYEELHFIKRGLTAIDEKTLLFKNLMVLNLCDNNLMSLQNIPTNCQEVYVDFNQISEIKVGKSPHEKLILLSISNNKLENSHIKAIKSEYPNLRSLNVANNLIDDIRNLLSTLQQFPKLKFLSTSQNPISMLKIYYNYLTEGLDLKMFDGEKYQKPQPPKKVIQTPKPQIKQQVKELKKDPKKDIKKNSKQPQPIKQEKPKTQPIIQEKKKQLTEQDFTKCNLHLYITNFQNLTGNIYDPSLFPADFPVEKTQTNYWLEYSLPFQNGNTQNKKIRFDQATIIENQPNRLSFDFQIVKQYLINKQNLNAFNKGFIVSVFNQEPKMELSENGELRPVKQSDQVLLNKTKIGEVFVDLKQLLTKKQKQIQKLYYLWQPQICSRPFFKNPLPNEQQQINKRKDQYELILKKQQQQRKKKVQQQEAAKNQKKTSKDTKKTDKKPQKKEGKQVIGQKKALERSNYPLDQKNYCFLNENKIYKAKKQTLAIRVWIS